MDWYICTVTDVSVGERKRYMVMRDVYVYLFVGGGEGVRWKLGIYGVYESVYM